MKPIALHPISVLVGCALAGLAAVLAGAAQAPGHVHPVPKEVRLIGEIPAEWWTYFRLHTLSDGTPLDTFTVPTDKHLVVMRWEGNNNVLANGQSISQSLSPLGPSLAVNVVRVSIPPGTVLTAPAGSQTMLWGYLEPL